MPSASLPGKPTQSRFRMFIGTAIIGFFNGARPLIKCCWKFIAQMQFSRSSQHDLELVHYLGNFLNCVLSEKSSRPRSYISRTRHSVEQPEIHEDSWPQTDQAAYITRYCLCSCIAVSHFNTFTVCNASPRLLQSRLAWYKSLEFKFNWSNTLSQPCRQRYIYSSLCFQHQ